jgi:hypothetical protein
MKRLLFVFMPLFLFSFHISAQQPQVVRSIAREDKPHSFFVEQAELWWKEIQKDKRNEKAWYYYYKANRYAQITFNDCKTPECLKCSDWKDENSSLKDAKDITALITKAIPNTFTYYIVIKEGYPNNQERLNALQKAYALEPDNPDTYDEFVVYYETNNIPDKRIEFNKKWFATNDVSAGILNYNYNVLISMENGGAILTFGDNDTFPIWMLQDVMGIRPDITVLNVNLLTIPEYRAILFKKLNIPALDKEYPDGSTQVNINEILDHIVQHKPARLPLYISTPTWKQLQEYDENLYLVGLVMQYSTENLDNLALLINNFENRYALDYIHNQFNFDISSGIVDWMNVNYLPGIIKLYQHYRLSGETEKAARMKELGLLIADKNGGDWKEKAIQVFQ